MSEFIVRTFNPSRADLMAQDRFFAEHPAAGLALFALMAAVVAGAFVLVGAM